MNTGKCGDCGHCQAVAAGYNSIPHPQHGKAYGWCMAPLPAHATTRQPLIYHKEMRGKVCPVWVLKEAANV
jgi:hypothetical protein